MVHIGVSCRLSLGLGQGQMLIITSHLATWPSLAIVGAPCRKGSYHHGGRGGAHGAGVPLQFRNKGAGTEEGEAEGESRKSSMACLRIIQAPTVAIRDCSLPPVPGL